MEGREFIVKLKAGMEVVATVHLKEQLQDPRYRQRAQVAEATSLSSLFLITDLLVSDLSKTIEEALTNWIPVFLHTWRRRYQHFPARFDPPAEATMQPFTAYARARLSR